MDLSVSTLSGRIANTPTILNKKMKRQFENIPKNPSNYQSKTLQTDWIFIKCVLWIFRKYWIFPENTKVLGQPKGFQFKNFQTFWKFLMSFPKNISAKS